MKTQAANQPLVNRLALLFVFLTASFLGLTANAAEEYSELNLMLFDKAHMKNLPGPGELRYKFTQHEGNKVTMEDDVIVAVSNLYEKELSDQEYTFFTGANNLHFEKRLKQRGNALFILFLEHDVRLLQHQTKGSWRHFQRRIRWGMADKTNTTREEVDIDYKGKVIKGVKYTFQPYVSDKDSDRYGIYHNKYYSFTLSDEIPGTLYELRTVVPKTKTWKEGETFISDERLVFSEFIPKK